MPATLRWPAFVLAAVLLVACTRERPTPEPTATSAVPASEAVERQPTQALEPQVSSTTPQAAPGESQTPTAAPLATPSPEPQQTFQYVVEAGDTLGTIATRFGTDVATIRRLNNLDSDAVYVGQPLYVPYVEGMTAEGMPTPTPGPFYYTIQPGDTLSGIAARFGVSTIAIVEANNLLDPNNLTVGSTILIPNYQPTADEQAPAAAGGEVSTPGGDPVIHIVQAGEGLIGIAEQYGLTADEIAAANGLTDRNNLRVGQQLIIPGLTTRDAAAARGSIHVVQPGESLLGIAVQYGLTVEELMTANNIANPDAINVGQELIIPGN